MPSLVKMAEHLGITKTRVCQLKKRGMPMSSFKAADKWREKEELKRTPTNNCKNAAVVKEKELPKTFLPPSNTGDSLLDALKNSISIADAAYEDYQLARANPELNRSARLSEHNKALDARLKAEEAYRKEMERRKLLVPKHEILERTRRIIENVLRRIKKLPQEQGPQTNPENALHATNVLTRAVDDILSSCQSALREVKEAEEETPE
jgi:hypothetical protein